MLVVVLMDRVSPSWEISTDGLDAATAAIFLRNIFTPERTQTEQILNWQQWSKQRLSCSLTTGSEFTSVLSLLSHLIICAVTHIHLHKTLSDYLPNQSPLQLFIFFICSHWDTFYGNNVFCVWHLTITSCAAALPNNLTRKTQGSKIKLWITSWLQVRIYGMSQQMVASNVKHMWCVLEGLSVCWVSPRFPRKLPVSEDGRVTTHQSLRFPQRRREKRQTCILDQIKVRCSESSKNNL